MLDTLSAEELEILQLQLGRAEAEVDALAELVRYLYDAADPQDQSLIEDAFCDLSLDL